MERVQWTRPVRNFATVPRHTLVVAVGIVLAASAAGQIRADWRHIGNSAVELGLAGLASGPVERAWYTPTGLRIRTGVGQVLETTKVVTYEVTIRALRERSYTAVMAATGLMYLAILTAFGADLVARAVLA